MRAAIQVVCLVLALPCATCKTCSSIGIEAPQNTSLVAGDGKNALIVSPSCDDKEIKVDSYINPGEYMIEANDMNIESVLSYPNVEALHLTNNAISYFVSDGPSLKEVDLTGNGLTSLSGIHLPDSLQQLFLDLNSIEKAKASDFPAKLQDLWIRKNELTSLGDFRFPSRLQQLYANGNTDLSSLEGAVFPDTLRSFECSNCGVTSIQGFVIPSKLQKLTLGGASVSTFEVRESDLAVLRNAQLNIEVSVSSCTDGELENVGKFSICVIDDDTFASKYPSAFEKESDSNGENETGTSTSDGSKKSDDTGKASGTDADPKGISTPASSSSLVDTDQSGFSTDGTASSDKPSNSTTYVIVSVVVGAVIIAAIILAVFIRQRRKHREDSYTGVPGQITNKPGNQAPPASGGTDFATLSMNESVVGETFLTNTSGYLSNDVRNDTMLIPYRMSQEALQIVGEIAHGGYGTVSLASLYGQDVVVKRLLPKYANDAALLKMFMDEIRLYARLEHPKIVRFIGLSWTNLMDLSLLLEYMPNGDLNALLKETAKSLDGRQRFTWMDPHSSPTPKASIALDVAEALVYLHSLDQPVMHRDLKSKNILLGSDFEAKVGDFGVSREVLDEETNSYTGGVGTTAWIAPEVLLGDHYSTSADIYSFGILLSELDTCGHPYNGHKRGNAAPYSEAKIALLVTTTDIKPLVHDDCPSSVRQLIMDCVSRDPKARPTAVNLHYRLRQLWA